MKTYLLFIFLLILNVTGIAQTCESQRYRDTIFSSVQITSNVYFGTATQYGLLAQPQDLYLDFYEPAGDTISNRPLIVFQFGGGFLIGFRSQPDIPGFCNYFAKCGYAVASIDYRLGFNATDAGSAIRAVYRGIQDERAAIRFLSANQQQLRIDTSNIILTGTSAGCFSGLANGFMGEADRPAPTFGTLLEPTDLGCVDCSGNNDYGRRIPRIKAIINQWGAILDTALIETGENIPVISFHGNQDNIVPYEYGYPFSVPIFPNVYGSKLIHDRLNTLGVENELRTLWGYGHEPELLNTNLKDTIYRYSRDFLFRLLRPNTSAIVGDSVTCTQTPATYSVQATPRSTYCWSLSGNGTIVSNTGNSISVIWSDTGTVSVSVKEKNYIGAEGEEQTFGTRVFPSVNSFFGYQANELEVTFLSLSSGADTYNWSFGDGSISTVQHPVKTFLQGGSYTITLVAANPGCSDSHTTTLIIDSCPVAAITNQVNNLNVFLNAVSTNTTSYFWQFGDGDSTAVNFPNVFHQYAEDGTYMVVLRVRNVLGCEDTDTLYLQLGVNGLNDWEKQVQIFYASGYIELHLANIEEWFLEVTDLSGRAVFESKFRQNLTLDTSPFPSGAYLLRLTKGNQMLVKKWMHHR